MTNWDTRLASARLIDKLSSCCFMRAQTFVFPDRELCQHLSYHNFQLPLFFSLCQFRSSGIICSRDVLDGDPSISYVPCHGIGEAGRLWFRCFLKSDESVLHFSLCAPMSLAKVSPTVKALSSVWFDTLNFKNKEFFRHTLLDPLNIMIAPPPFLFDGPSI